MHTTSIFVGLSALVGSVVSKPVNFTIFAAAADTQFWDIPINAVDGQFKIFRPLEQLCPETNKDCVKYSHTIIQGDDEKGPLSLGSQVPGGQEIFITKEGILGFKKVGDKAIPAGAVGSPTGFTYVKPISRWQDLGKLVYSGGNFSLCGPDDNTAPSYTLYIQSADTKLPSSECTTIEVGARYSSVKEQVWAYN